MWTEIGLFYLAGIVVAACLMALGEIVWEPGTTTAWKAWLLGTNAALWPILLFRMRIKR